MQISDSDLWDSFRNGNAEAFAAIYQKFAAELLTYGFRLSPDRQLVKDTVQSLFLHIWEHRRTVSPTDSIKFYLFRSLRNALLQTKRLNKEFVLEEGLEELAEVYLPENSIEQVLIRKETHDARMSFLHRGLESLSVRQKEIIQLRYYHNLSTEEISNILKINNQSVRNLLHRTIAQLRMYLGELPPNWMVSVIPIFFQ